MDLGTFLSTILLVSFIVTIILAVGSYMAYKLRERRRPRGVAPDRERPVFFERVDLAALAPPAASAAPPSFESEP